MMIDTLLILGAYLLGSVSAAIVVCRLAGFPDPRTGGSGNPGATNVLRLAGRGPAAATLAGDFCKGLLPVLLAAGLQRAPEVLALVGLAALLGHVYPLFFGFRGGKGVATALGVLLAWSWQALLLVALVWLLTAAVFRYASLAALASFLAAPLTVWLFPGQPSLNAAMTVISVLVFWRHRSNIRSLLAGRERRIGRRG